MIKYKIILKTSHKYTERVQNCLDTWLTDLDYVCITDKLTGKFNEISVSQNDNYNSNEEKTINFINLAKQSGLLNQYDWLIFIDDDAILNVKYFEYLAQYLDKNKFYGLCMGGCPQNPNISFPSGGASYFISPQLMNQLTDMYKPEWSTGGTEDVIVGNWLHENNIEIHQKVDIEGKEHHFKLNGWFPFSDESKLLTPEENSNPESYMQKMLEYIGSNREEFIMSHLTHHYIRHKEFMHLIYNHFSRWNTTYISF